MEPKWYESHGELVAFARHMVESGGEWDVHNLMDYLEKPWKWTPERDGWIASLGLAALPNGEASGVK